MGEIEGDMAQPVPMLRLLQGDVGSGKTLVALEALLIAVEAGAQGALLAPTEILARQHFETLSRQLAGLAGQCRHPHRPREGQGAGIDLDGPRRRLDRHPRRHPRHLPAGGELQKARPCRGGRAASLRRRPAHAAHPEGRAAAASAGDDGDADPAHPDAHPIWRDGRQPARRDAARPPADRDARAERRAAARGGRTRLARHIAARRPGLLGLPVGRGERGERPGRRRGAGAGAASCASATRSAWSTAG